MPLTMVEAIVKCLPRAGSRHIGIIIMPATQFRVHRHDGDAYFFPASWLAKCVASVTGNLQE